MKIFKRHKSALYHQSVRETIDSLPCGICFSTPSGRPILTNRRMNELIYCLTGHTVMNAQTVWDELRQSPPAHGCARLNEPWLNPECEDNCLFFSLSDGSIWRIRRDDLTDRPPYYIQLEATVISDLYRYSKKLYKNNKMLAEQYARQQNLLANIVEINHEKELLAMKMRIHDDLGRSILTTRQHLQNGTFPENIPHLADIWNHTVKILSDATQIHEETGASPEIELQKAAEMIGCHISFSGSRPTDRKTELLFYSAIREALTNAVRHAGADELLVTVTRTAKWYQMEISDNGRRAVASVAEGNGLGNLRRRLEQEGATLEVRCDNGVSLIVRFPVDGRGHSEKGEIEA